jgi:hypothetical protein
MACYGDSFYFMYITMHVPNREHMRFTACYGDSVILYVYYDALTMQGTYLWVSKACYRNSFTFYVHYDARTSQGTH